MGSHLQRRLEKHIAQASMGLNKSNNSIPNNLNRTLSSSHQKENGNMRMEKGLSSWNGREVERRPSDPTFNYNVNKPMTATGTLNPNPPPTSAAVPSSVTPPSLSLPSGFDTRKVPGLLPPQRLAIPHKSNSGSSSHHLHTQEFKPLVQWDSDERLVHFFSNFLSFLYMQMNFLKLNFHNFI